MAGTCPVLDIIIYLEHVLLKQSAKSFSNYLLRRNNCCDFFKQYHFLLIIDFLDEVKQIEKQL